MNSGNPPPAAETDWAAAMRAGDFARAWAINDRDLPALCAMAGDKHGGPRHLQRIWRGESLTGKRVLVRCYHGLGDTIQFIRFMPALRAIASEVTVWCQPELLELLRHAPGVDRLLPLHDGVPEVDFDVDIEIMEVPHAIRATPDVVQAHCPYLTAPPHADISPNTRGGLAVGLAWEVGDWDKKRSIPPLVLRRLDVEGVKLYSLQRGPATSRAIDIGAEDISTPDICGLAQRIRQLDVVVCVDTMIAHLAGALACEAWILLHADCDWRWPASGTETLWYPTLRLFRQGSAEDWAGVIEDVRTALMACLREKRRTATGAELIRETRPQRNCAREIEAARAPGEIRQ